MSAFFANIQVRSDDRDAVAAAVDALLAQAGYAPEPEAFGGDRSIYIGPAVNGWIGVYDSACDGSSIGPLAWLAQGLSSRLGSVTLAWLVHDSALLVYLLFDQGEVADRYVSHPDYLQPARPAQPSTRRPPAGPLGGDGARLLEVAGVPGEGRTITRWLRRPEPFAQTTLRRVAGALGQRYADLGHEEIEADQLAETHLEDPAAFDRREYVRHETGPADTGRSPRPPGAAR
jgi:hypothetical protein